MKKEKVKEGKRTSITLWIILATLANIRVSRWALSVGVNSGL